MQKGLQIKSTMKRIKQEKIDFHWSLFPTLQPHPFLLQKFNTRLPNSKFVERGVSFHYKRVNPKLSNLKFKISVDLDWSSVGETRNDSIWFTGLGSLAGLNIWAGLNVLGKKLLRQVFDALKIECVE